MFNEYEGDPDDSESQSFDMGTIIAIENFEADQTEGSGGEPGFFMERVRDDITTDVSAVNVLEVLEGQRFEQDKIFYDISNASGTGYDKEGFVAPGFTFHVKRINEIIDGRAALDSETFAGGDIGIYADVIEDKVATGGDIASGEFTVYSSVGTSRHIPPSFKIERTRSPGFVDFGDPESWGTEAEGATIISKINYSSGEEQAFFVKYATVQGSTGNTFDEPVTTYLNNIFNTMALDVYNTVLTREYVPKLIKQEMTSVSAMLSVSIGDEIDPLESTIYESTTTFEEEA